MVENTTTLNVYVVFSTPMVENTTTLNAYVVFSTHTVETCQPINFGSDLHCIRDYVREMNVGTVKRHQQSELNMTQCNRHQKIRDVSRVNKNVYKIMRTVDFN